MARPEKSKGKGKSKQRPANSDTDPLNAPANVKDDRTGITRIGDIKAVWEGRPDGKTVGGASSHMDGAIPDLQAGQLRHHRLRPLHRTHHLELRILCRVVDGCLNLLDLPFLASFPRSTPRSMARRAPSARTLMARSSLSLGRVSLY